MAGDNRNTGAAWTFHNGTKYGAVRDAAGAEQFLMGTPPEENPIWQEDWSIEPYPFKVYETLPPLAIPRTFPTAPIPAPEALARTGAESVGEAILDRAALARIGLLTAGLLNRQSATRSGRTIEFRTAGGTGARYHLELYFVCAGLPDLPAGVYHYAAHDHSLRQLRAGDFRGALVDATGAEPAVACARVVLALTSTFWRNAWRYKARAYRHTYWDAGTTLANALAATASAQLPTRLVIGYADGAVNALLGIDGEREATVALCTIGRTAGEVPLVAPVPPLDHPTRPISEREVVFPLIPMMHRASSLGSGAEVADWRAQPLRRALPAPQGDLISLRPLAPEQLAAISVDELIFKRRSTRHYAVETPLTFEEFSTLLDRSSGGVAADCLASDAPPLYDAYLIVNNVAGLAPGIYLHHPLRGAVELLKAGTFRRQAERLAFAQAYAGEAQANLYCLADLRPVLARYGNRGYRVAQLTAALAASRLHLVAHTLGLGAVGSTSFDDEVIDFFSPHAAGKSYLFVLAFGRRRRRDRTG